MPDLCCRLRYLARVGTLVTAALVSGLALEAQPEDLGGWRVVSTAHFTIYTDADTERGIEIATSLELFRNVFARLAPALELRSPAPTKILAFGDEASYAPYKTNADPRLLGQFLSHPDGNYITLDAGTQLVGSFAIIYHEYVHYFVRHNFPGIPLWFNEGLAEYYSTFAVEGETARVGSPVPRHRRWFARDGEFSLDEILAVTRQSADYQEERKAGGFYAVSWALVHYLLSGGDERLERMADFLLALDSGEDPYDAFEAAFDTRLRTVEKELRAYVQGAEFAQATFEVADLQASAAARVRAARPQDVLHHLGDLLVHLGRRDAAEHHFQGALDLDPEHAESYAGLALVRDLAGRFGEAEVLYGDALDLGSNDPLTYLLYGRHLLRRLSAGDADQKTEVAEIAARARSILKQVLRLDGDFAEGYALFGYAHCFGEVDPAPGLDALRRAHAWLPQRHDVTLYLIELYLKDRAFDQAEKLLESALIGRAEEALVAQASAGIERARLLDAASQAFEKRQIERGVELFDQAISVTRDGELRARMEERLRQLQERYGLD